MKEAGKGLLIAGYILSILGGLFGIALAIYLMTSKEAADNGSKILKFDDKSRRHGKIMLIIAATVTLTILIIRFVAPLT